MQRRSQKTLASPHRCQRFRYGKKKDRALHPVKGSDSMLLQGFTLFRLLNYIIDADKRQSEQDTRDVASFVNYG